jgi:hypothetical protein
VREIVNRHIATDPQAAIVIATDPARADTAKWLSGPVADVLGLLEKRE